MKKLKSYETDIKDDLLSEVLESNKKYTKGRFQKFLWFRIRLFLRKLLSNLKGLKSLKIKSLPLITGISCFISFVVLSYFGLANNSTQNLNQSNSNTLIISPQKSTELDSNIDSNLDSESLKKENIQSKLISSSSSSLEFKATQKESNDYLYFWMAIFLAVGAVIAVLILKFK